ncbi:MAG TPA: hypothetical protein VKB51_14265 [bacterium]|nr:hypothetical protein [bacterium]
MKKLLAIALVIGFTAAVMSPAAFANCGKDHSGKTATSPTTSTTKTTKA